MTMQRLSLLLLCGLLAAGCSSSGQKPQEAQSAPAPLQTETLGEQLTFCEGSTVYNGQLLLSNFGGEQLDPLNQNGKGYIATLRDGKTEIFLPADGHMNAPKGMAVHNDHLYIADVGKVLVYNLLQREQAPVSISLPQGQLFVNDIAIAGNDAYISVTNTGDIFRLDLSAPEALDASKLQAFAHVPGANGLLVDGKQLYVASYPADGKTTPDNVIYHIADLAHPQPQALINVAGQYDGLALQDGKLFFSDWTKGSVGYVNLANKKVHLLPISPLQGPADFTLLNGKLYVPDLPASQVVVIGL